MKKINIIIFIIVFAYCLTGCAGNKNCDFIIENSSYSYESEKTLNIDALHPYDDTYFEELRNKYHLDDLVADAESDFEKVQAVTEWVTSLWEHDGWNTPEKNDPLFILDEVVENGQRFRCVEYGIVIYGCLNAIGIPARTLALKTEDVETRESGAGHVVAEVYLKDIHKWIFVDGQWGMIPMLNDTPLDGVEFAQALKDKKELGNSLDVIQLLPGNSKNHYFSWIKEYLYYFDFTFWQKDDNRMLEPKSIMLTPLDAKNPTIFQINYDINVDDYTHSVVDFYPEIR